MPTPFPKGPAIMSPTGRADAAFEMWTHRVPSRENWEELGEKVSYIGIRQGWQPWGLFTVSSSDRSQHLQRPPQAKQAWRELSLLWEQKPTCVATVGASWAHSKWWIDWFVYWAFYLFCPEWWMNLVKEKGRERTIGFGERSVSCRVAEAAPSS